MPLPVDSPTRRNSSRFVDRIRSLGETPRRHRTAGPAPAARPSNLTAAATRCPPALGRGRARRCTVRRRRRRRRRRHGSASPPRRAGTPEAAATSQQQLAAQERLTAHHLAGGHARMRPASPSPAPRRDPLPPARAVDGRGGPPPRASPPRRVGGRRSARRPAARGSPPPRRSPVAVPVGGVGSGPSTPSPRRRGSRWGSC